MSYCRFSSDNWASDVYCYESVGDFFAIHVAGSRYAHPEPHPEQPERWWEKGEAGMAAYAAYAEASDAWIEAARLEPIGLPHDGASFDEPDAKSAADRLEYLKGLGYHVPQYAIDALREGAAEESAGTSQ